MQQHKPISTGVRSAKLIPIDDQPAKKTSVVRIVTGLLVMAVPARMKKFQIEFQGDAALEHCWRYPG